MLKLNFTPFPVLVTERLLLRKVNKNDADEIFILRSDARVMKYLDRAPAESLNDAHSFIKLITRQEKYNEAVTWAITIKGNPKLIGTICYWNIKPEHYRAETGYVLLPEYHGKGIMHEALVVVLNYGFNVMKLHSIEANVNPANQASIKLLEKNKFVREAYFKENYFYEGKFMDTAIYSLVASGE